MPSRPANKADRIFVRDGRRHYRRRFSSTEPWLGAGILVVLAAILGWVIWRGANPDPALFMLETDLSQGGAAAGGTVMADRGPVPAELAGAGWTEGDISQFDSDNLYAKINGREGYYKAFGFERLYFASITREDDPATAVDIELFDLGGAANAVGAYSGERPPGVSPEVGETGLGHIDRNALMMTRGRFYLRALGSDESPEVRAQLEYLRGRFDAGLPGEPLPWGFALLVGAMGMDAGAVSYARENAFSFGFATNVYTAAVDEAGDVEVFVTPAAGEAEAADLAGRYREGFLQYGSPDGTAGGVQWIRDRYLETIAGARAVGPWVIGIRGAPDVAAAATALEPLAEAVSAFPLPGDAAPGPAEADAETDGYTDDEPSPEESYADEY